MFPARSRCESANSFPPQDSGFLGDWLDGIEIQGRNQESEAVIGASLVKKRRNLGEEICQR